MTCPCEGTNPENLREVINCVEPTLFHRVDRPASLGDDTVTSADQLDYKNVLLVYEANNHAYLYSSDGVPTFISMGDVNTEELEAKIQQLFNELANETSEREQADANLQSQLTDLGGTTGQQIADLQYAVTSVSNDVTALQSTTVQKDTTVSADTSTVTLTKTTGELSEAGTETALPLPVASTESAGVMNASTYAAVQENSENIDSILGGAVVIDDLTPAPSQTELTESWKTATGKDVLINRASIYDTENKLVWYYYENANEWKSMPAGDAAVSVSIATNDTAGIVKGSTEDGQVAVEADGSMSLNGYDGMQHDIENLSQLVAGIEVPRVYEYTAGAASPNILTVAASITDTVQLSLQYANKKTGAGGFNTVVLPLSSDTRGGIMSATDKSKLDSLLEIKSLNDSLSLDENGQLSVVGGGSDVNLLSAYTDTVGDNDVYNAGYVNSRLNDINISIGSQTQTAGYANVAIGYLAKATNIQSAAFGSGSVTSRMSEISFGNPNESNTARRQRYLANVKAGELPTDAVNLQQMQDYVAEHAGGGSGNLPDTILTAVSFTDTMLDDSYTSSSVPVRGYNFQKYNTATGDMTTVVYTQRLAGESVIGSQPAAGLVTAAERAKINNITPLTAMEQTRVSNLPPAVVTGFEDTTYGTDTITMHLDTKDLATGGVAVQELALSAAAPATEGATGSAGIMSTVQATQLATLAEAYEAEEKGINLYSGTASVNTIELSQSATNFDHVRIIGEYMSTGSSAMDQSITVDFYPSSTVHSFQMTATDITVGDTPMVTTYQDIWMLSDDGVDLDLISSSKAEQGAGTLTCTPDTTSQFTIVKIVGFGKI